MLSDGKSRRFEERQNSSLSVRVRCREDINSEWNEATHLLDVSRMGARLILSRPVETGQLLHFTLDMPRRFRAYDHTTKEYHVWGVIRSVTEVAASDLAFPSFEVGVAFIGKFAPDSYMSNPMNRYDIKPAPNSQGLWEARIRPRKELD